MDQPIQDNVLRQVKAELDVLDSETVTIDGVQLKPSQCYRIGTDPLHILFNTNCPDTVKDRVQAILSKYIAPHASRTQGN